MDDIKELWPLAHPEFGLMRQPADWSARTFFGILGDTDASVKGCALPPLGELRLLPPIASLAG
jgi:hypothetical protein